MKRYSIRLPSVVHRESIIIPPHLHKASFSVQNLLQQYFDRIHEHVVLKTKTAKPVIGKILHIAPQRIVVPRKQAQSHKLAYGSAQFSALVRSAVKSFVVKIISARKKVIARVGTKVPTLLVAKWRILEEFDLMILSALDQTALCDMDYKDMRELEEGGGSQ